MIDVDLLTRWDAGGGGGEGAKQRFGEIIGGGPRSRRDRRVGGVRPASGGVRASAAEFVDVRPAFRLATVLSEAKLAGGPRTASRWFRAGGVRDDWDRFCDLPPSIGKKLIAWRGLAAGKKT